MGGKQSVENDVNSMINSTISTSVASSLNLNAVQESTNVVSLEGCKGVSNMSVLQKSSIKVSEQGFLKAFQKSMADQDINEMVKNALKQSMQNVTLGFTDQEAKQTTNMTTNLFTELKQAVSTNCSSGQFMQNAVTCKNSENLDHIQVNQDNVAESALNCAMQSGQVTEAKTKLVSYLENTIAQKQENALWALAAVILACGLLVVAVVGAPAWAAQKMGGKALQMFVALALFMIMNVYLYKECVQHAFPFWKFWIITIFPKWCSKPWMGILSFSLTWFLFAFMMFLAYLNVEKSSLPNKPDIKQ